MKASLKILAPFSSTYGFRAYTISASVDFPMRTVLQEMPAQSHTNQKIACDKTIDQFSLMNLIDSSFSSNGFAPTALLFHEFSRFIDCNFCNTLIRRYTDSKNHSRSVFVYTQMRKLNILPDSSTFPSVLKSVAQLCYGEVGKSIHCNAIQLGFNTDIYTNTALVYMYGICQQPDDARQLFDEIPERNVVTWNALITSYTHNRKFREAIDVFREMLASGAKPGEVTMVGVLSACSHLGALSQGKWIHDYIVRNRLRVNVFVGTALIDMYAKCGDIDEAEKVFKTMGFKNIYTWNVLISAYAMNGQGEAALQAFDRMVVEDFKPDDVTYLGILCACCHQGFVEEGRRRFSNMINQFGLQPKIVHYGCMIDLLGRGGFLDEALEMIHSMRINPDAVIWRALLGACRFHGREELGEFAFRKLMELEPTNGENYVLISNVYIRKKQWAEVGDVRELMDSGGIKKIPGCSSIEIENVVYEFKASDPLKTGHEEIHKMLKDMKSKLKLAGYVAETEMALYDIDEEDKEHNLIYHSEKLALAYGLLNSSEPTLRIMKNLRICQDCHQFFKLASAIYKRTIVVRDIKRFHHFIGGLCSCKDYW
ncbi:PREDICTED: pentatricopeptide repeat-containing protein At2g02980, chloroplastic-like [Nicotiana attenuata]|uniref:Pentatricopeptide repeat-containing protein, chloroplastic n=1 Tax=Nicotiana attenuata TaxID=49451 RepID=A0A1J6IGQ2_NICAT|nr:PREDICTED: pentatricopeptide repeat-containing protein At2g02980, chloroplastic-like [Nicotiana attenuata]XP_019252436.1 PREDICTED: pentatricopeptide repeat-containing protein At2g02980, chloroplastic-like [Nicotiana attenuata]OIS99695.1 pentatricopeptide repeat-containing protein, chloroplastic [Nicotiana attenuata]